METKLRHVSALSDDDLLLALHVDEGRQVGSICNNLGVEFSKETQVALKPLFAKLEAAGLVYRGGAYRTITREGEKVLIAKGKLKEHAPTKFGFGVVVPFAVMERIRAKLYPEARFGETKKAGFLFMENAINKRVVDLLEAAIELD